MFHTMRTHTHSSSPPPPCNPKLSDFENRIPIPPPTNPGYQKIESKSIKTTKATTKYKAC